MINSHTTTRHTAKLPASESNGYNPTLAAAIAYTRRGWHVVPIPRGSKNPGDAYGKGWQDARLELDDLPRYFSLPINLGVLLGEPSGGIVEADLDCRFARALAPHFLPPTDLRSGRLGSPNSHWWYKATGLAGSPTARTKRFQELGDDPDKAGDDDSAVDDRNVIVELRSTRGQTVAPPSIHPTGEAYRWESEGEPATVDAVELFNCVSRLAAHALLARHWSDGSRHDLAMALAGGLRRAGWAVDDIKESIRLVAQAAGDDDMENRIEVAEDTCAKLDAGEVSVTGFPTFAELTSEGIQKRVIRWLGLSIKARSMLTDCAAGVSVNLEDFWAHSPSHTFIFVPTREPWSATSVNSRVRPIPTGKKKDNGKEEFIPASQWLDENRAVEQMTWAPGEPLVIHDRLIAEGGWFRRPGASCFNLYKAPEVTPGDPKDVDLWLDHIRYVYPDAADAIICWLAHRVQRPWEKINHALVLGGGQGIGKDTLLEPVKYAVGSWNFAEIAPHHLLGRFNGFVKSVVLRISEARDLGDVDRYSFYERLKLFTAAPPDVIRVDEKNVREYSVPNLCGVVLTTNHTDGIFLPPDDRRHYVAWSDCAKEDFPEKYWRTIHSWYAEGGSNNVAAYLKAYDLVGFNPKAPPKQSEAWRRIVDAGRAPEDAELADAIDLLGTDNSGVVGRPNAFTLSQLTVKVSGSFYDWLTDRRNRRTIPHRIEAAGYVSVRNPDANDGLWKIDGKRQAVYARRDLPINERFAAVKEVSR